MFSFLSLNTEKAFPLFLESAAHLERIPKDGRLAHQLPGSLARIHTVGLTARSTTRLPFPFSRTEPSWKEVSWLLLHPHRYHLLFPQPLEFLRSWISQLPVSATYIVSFPSSLFTLLQLVTNLNLSKSPPLTSPLSSSSS